MGDIINPQSKLEEIAYATVLIQTEYGSGTGFLLQKDLGDGRIIPLLITNKHVIYGFDKDNKKNILAEKGKLIFHTMDENKQPSGNFTEFVYEKHFGKHFFQHPNPNIDLCAINLATFINLSKKIPPEVFVKYISTHLIPTEEELKALDYMEDVIMVGYPEAMRDTKHNYPIIRKGVTATHPYIDFDGKKEFLADIATYGGSSGSPVFLLKMNYLDKDGTTYLGNGLFYFMGIACAVETASTYVNEKEPIILKQEPNVRAAMNLAHIIKSSELFELLNLFPSTSRQNEEEYDDK